MTHDCKNCLHHILLDGKLRKHYEAYIDAEDEYGDVLYALCMTKSRGKKYLELQQRRAELENILPILHEKFQKTWEKHLINAQIAKDVARRLSGGASNV